MMPCGSIKVNETDKKPKPSEPSKGSYPTLEATAEGLNIRLVSVRLTHTQSDNGSFLTKSND